MGSRFAFCDLRGPTDLIAYRQEIVFANALPWRPRPVFQSYAAYTPDLLRDNAEHYTGPRAPDNVLFQLETIDGRFPSLDDSLLWPILLTRYDIVDLRSPYLVLRRASPPRPHVLVPLGEQMARLGDHVAVPAAASGLV